MMKSYTLFHCYLTEADAIHDPADAILYQNSVSGGEGNAASAFLLPMPNPATCAASWYNTVGAFNDLDKLDLTFCTGGALTSTPYT